MVTANVFRFERAPSANCVRLAAGVHLLPLNGDGVLIARCGAEPFHLEPSRAAILDRLLADGASWAVRELAESASLSRGQATREVAALLDVLRRLELIDESEGCIHLPPDGLGPRLLALPLMFVAWLLCPLPRLQARGVEALAGASLRWFGWSATVAAWQRSLASFLVDSDERHWSQAAASIDWTLGPQARQSSNTKVLALCRWFLLRRLGIPAELVLGFTVAPLAGEAWCEIGLASTDGAPGRLPIARYV